MAQEKNKKEGKQLESTPVDQNPISTPNVTPVLPVTATPATPVETTKPVPTKSVLYFVEETTTGILPKHVQMVKKAVGSATGDILYLVLHTYGGDVYSAVKIMRILQDKFKEIKIIIPEHAYSSGTIMSIAGDEIYMAVDATLGPLDKPSEHPTDGSDISSLDVTQTLTNLSSICISTASSIYEKLREDMKLSKLDASTIAFKTATDIICPITGKIDPYNLQRGFREAKIGLFYAIDMLTSRMMSKNFSQAIKTSRALVDNYPSHGYGIFRDEAEYPLGLNVKNLESLSEWKTLETKYKEYKEKYSIKIEFSIL